nr:pentatricopeptide repeat-containing protein, chloroplastic [Quercus suber]
MPLCCCSLRFAARNLVRHRSLRPNAPQLSLQLFKSRWRFEGWTTHRSYASSKRSNVVQAEGGKGWFEYFDAVLEDAENSSQPGVLESRKPSAVEHSTAFGKARLQMIEGSHVASGEEVRVQTDNKRRRADRLHGVPAISSSRRQRSQWRFERPPSRSDTVFFYGRKVLSVRRSAAKARFRRQEIRTRIAFLTKDAHVRPKFVSLRNFQRPTAMYSIKWQSNFARISRKYDKLLQGHYLGPSEVPVLYPATSDWVESILDHLDGSTGNISPLILENRDVQHGGQMSRWPQIALWLLAHEPERVVDFLLATHCEPYPPISWVEDCLSLLARKYTHANMTSPEPLFHQLADAFPILARRQTAHAAAQTSPQLERMFMGSSFIRLLLPYCSSQQVNKIYRSIKLYNVKVHFNTYHHISTWFAENGHLEQGIDALLSAQDAGSGVDSLPFRKNCSTLLRRTMQHPGGLRLSLRLVDNLVAMGVKLEGQLCTIIMLNAVEAEDYNTAFLVYRSMTDQGLTPDDHGFSILLRACKANPDDVNTLTEVIQCVVESGFVRNNRVLATEILHCLALHHSKRNPATVFTIVRDAYMELFNPRPLLKLGLPLTTPGGTISTSETKLHNPSQHAMNFMFAAYLENTTDEAATRLYDQWRELLHKGDEHAARLARTPHTATIFLSRFTRKKETLLRAAQVIKDMQQPLPSVHKLKQAPPDVITWSVFLHGFARHGQTKLAAQVLQYMRKQGIEPTKFTLNNLVAGCAGAQDLSGTICALQEMASMNKAFDEWTYKGLARYRNQAQLKEKMRKAQYERDMDFTSEMKDKLLQRVSDSTSYQTHDVSNNQISESVDMKTHKSVDEEHYQPIHEYVLL